MKAKFTALLLSACLFSAGAFAQPYAIDWHAIAGGGGASTGGVFTVTGTVGQPDANQQPLSGGNFSLQCGFWSFAVQTPGAPFLSIERQGPVLRVFWLLPASGFVLEESPTSSGTWSPVSFPYATNATHISISVSNPVANKFYRLQKPQ